MTASSHCKFCCCPLPYPGAPHCSNRECATKYACSVIAASPGHTLRPIKVTRSWRAEGCEPCGECRACRTEAAKLEQVKRLRAENAKLRRLLHKAAREITTGILCEPPEEIRDNPDLRAAQQLADRIERALKAPGGDE